MPSTPPPPVDPPDEPEWLDAITELLETDTERAVKRIVPWVVSVGAHVGLILLGFLATWSVMYLVEDETPVRVAAEFYNLTYDPLVVVGTEVTRTEEPLPPERMSADALERAVSQQLARVEPAALSVFAESAVASTWSEFAPATALDSASFLGIETSDARRIAYVIDASGSMIRSFDIVIEGLARSLDGLTAQQEFAIIFFQDGLARGVPPERRLQPATDAAKIQAINWIADNVTPAGLSNPLIAIEHALSLGPDVIFLLSENITGTGRFELNKADLLARLDELNPVRNATRGTRIQCLQFLEPDPLETLRAIAERHGGLDGYTFLDAAALGVAAP